MKIVRAIDGAVSSPDEFRQVTKHPSREKRAIDPCVSTFAERLEEVMAWRGLSTAEELAALTGVSAGHIAHLRKGTRGEGVGRKTIAKIVEGTGCDFEYLATGNGRRPGSDDLPRRLRHRSEWKDVIARVREEHPNLSDEELAAVAEQPDVGAMPLLDVTFVRDMAMAIAQWRARAERKAR